MSVLRKKNELIANGTERVTLVTRHGKFSFQRQRFLNKQREEVSLLTDKVSPLVKERCLSWAVRFPFSEVAHLLEEFSGTALLSEDSVWRIIQEAARQTEAEQGSRISSVLQDPTTYPSPTYQAVETIYEGNTQEFVTLTDAISVPSQKPTRQKSGEVQVVKEAQRHDTDVFVLPRRDGGEQFFCEGLSEMWSVVESVRAFLHEEWRGSSLSVVAITDGARSIRLDLFSLFGSGVRVILDWYHLVKRTNEKLSMSAHSSSERKEWLGKVLLFLWSGRVSEALAFLSGLTVRNESARQDLIGYFEKHASEIIDYGRRQKAGKPIGSGRMEKAVDQVIGIRQKNRGMAWTKRGSRALAMLKVDQLNQLCPNTA